MFRSTPSAVLVAAALLLAACAGPGRLAVQAGQSEAQMLAAMGEPTNRYAMPAGAQRVEYARGPQGRVTWMVDLDAQGRVTATEQVLTPANFARVRQGMTVDEVLRLLGRPADKSREYMRRETWSWRFETNDCLWLRISFSAEGRVIGGAGMMTDPRCDLPSPP